MDDNAIKYFVESALLAAGRPLSIDHLQRLFDDDSAPEKSQIREAITKLLEDYADRGITISEVDIPEVRHHLGTHDIIVGRPNPEGTIILGVNETWNRTTGEKLAGAFEQAMSRQER